jgi:RNA polymerase sigma-70 factor (ECF subfamily)
MRMKTRTNAKSKALDKNALIEIYETYNPKLFRYSYRLLGDQDLAEECVAETFSRFLSSLKGNHTGPDHIQAYLYRVAHNWITDYYRRKSPPEEPLQDNIHDRKNGNVSEMVGEQMEKERVRNALLQIPGEQRQVISLRFLEDQSHEKVSEILGKSPEATRALQYRALASLRRILLEPEEV